MLISSLVIKAFPVVYFDQWKNGLMHSHCQKRWKTLENPAFRCQPAYVSHSQSLTNTHFSSFFTCALHLPFVRIMTKVLSSWFSCMRLLVQIHNNFQFQFFLVEILPQKSIRSPFQFSVQLILSLSLLCWKMSKKLAVMFRYSF